MSRPKKVYTGPGEITLLDYHGPTLLARTIDLTNVYAGMTVWTYHRGKYRKGSLGKIAQKTTQKLGDLRIWVKMEDELKGTYYGIVIKPPWLIYSGEPKEYKIEDLKEMKE
jgi:hypothetical protein